MTKRTYLSRAAEPLLATARRMDWPQRQAWLDDLRTDAPTLIAEVERNLALRSAGAPPTADASPQIGFLTQCAQYLRMGPRRNRSHRLTWHT
jgi:hypothetical protein